MSSVMKFCPHCQARYAENLASCPRDGSPLFVLREGNSLAGKVLAERFRLDRLVGEGGFGSVYLATNLVLGKQVAVKLLKPEFASDPLVVERFIREARMVTRLSHPHTVATYDLYQDTTGIAALFLVMEYIEGTSLKDILKSSGRLPWHRAAGITLQVCESLQEAHEQGIVHRDLKPGNLMLCSKYGQNDFVKVLDFGIAKIVEGREEESLTETGGFVGTPAYMSPEQITTKKIDTRSDLYSLGVILYEMLGGILPYSAKETVMLLQMKVTTPPAPLSTRCPDAGVPPELETLVMSMMALDPGQRPANAAIVRSGLEAVLKSASSSHVPAAVAAPPAVEPHTVSMPGIGAQTAAYIPMAPESTPSSGGQGPTVAYSASEPVARPLSATTTGGSGWILGNGLAPSAETEAYAETMDSGAVRSSDKGMSAANAASERVTGPLADTVVTRASEAEYETVVGSQGPAQGLGRRSSSRHTLWAVPAMVIVAGVLLVLWSPWSGKVQPSTETKTEQGLETPSGLTPGAADEGSSEEPVPSLSGPQGSAAADSAAASAGLDVVTQPATQVATHVSPHNPVPDVSPVQPGAQVRLPDLPVPAASVSGKSPGSGAGQNTAPKPVSTGLGQPATPSESAQKPKQGTGIVNNAAKAPPVTNLQPDKTRPAGGQAGPAGTESREQTGRVSTEIPPGVDQIEKKDESALKKTLDKKGEDTFQKTREGSEHDRMGDKLDREFEKELDDFDMN